MKSLNHAAFEMKTNIYVRQFVVGSCHNDLLFPSYSHFIHHDNEPAFWCYLNSYDVLIAYRQSTVAYVEYSILWLVCMIYNSEIHLFKCKRIQVDLSIVRRNKKTQITVIHILLALHKLCYLYSQASCKLLLIVSLLMLNEKCMDIFCHAKWCEYLNRNWKTTEWKQKT